MGTATRRRSGCARHARPLRRARREPRRGAATLDALRADGVDEEALARVRSPAGLDLGPSTQEEIAVAILAELVAWRHSVQADVGAGYIRPLQATDPVCGMSVAVTDTAEATVHAGVSYYFCCAGCRERFEHDPTPYVEEVHTR